MIALNKNPYRLLGVFANTSEAELLKQKTRALRLLSVGKAEAAGTDFPLLGEISRTAESVDEAAKQIEQPQEKLVHSLLWFINHTPADGIAFEHLRNGHDDKAEGIWRLAVEGKEISAKNFSSCLNLSTLLFAKALKNGVGRVEIKALDEAFALKGRLLDEDGIGFIADIIVDGSLDGDASSLSGGLDDEYAERFADTVFDAVKPFLGPQMSAGQFIQSLKQFSDSVSSYLSSKLTERPVFELETAIAQAQERVEADKSDAAQAGLDLNAKGEPLLREIERALGPDDIAAEMARNNLANQILNCSIAYFNEFQAGGKINPGPETLRLIEMAKGLKPTGDVAQRIEQNMPIILEWIKDFELNRNTQVYRQLINVSLSECKNWKGETTSCELWLDEGLKMRDIIDSAKRDSRLNNEERAVLTREAFGLLIDRSITRVNTIQEELTRMVNQLEGRGARRPTKSAQFPTTRDRLTSLIAEHSEFLFVTRETVQMKYQMVKGECAAAEKLVYMAIKCGTDGDFRSFLQKNHAILKSILQGQGQSASDGLLAGMGERNREIFKLIALLLGALFLVYLCSKK